MTYAGYPSVAVPQQNVARPVRYPTMKVTVIRIFSVASIIFGLASIGIQVSIKKKRNIVWRAEVIFSRTLFRFEKIS